MGLLCCLNKGTDGVCLNANQSTVLVKLLSVWFQVNYFYVRSYFPTKCPSSSLSLQMKSTLVVKIEGGIRMQATLQVCCTHFPFFSGHRTQRVFVPNKYFLIDMSSSSWTQFTAAGMQCVIFGAVLYTLQRICTWGQNGTDNCFWGLHRLVHHCILTKC